MNYGWPMNRKREKKREVHALCFFSSSWVMEVSRCECCHADGDPGVLQKGRGGRIKNRENSRGGKKTKWKWRRGIAFVLFLFLLNKNRLNRTGSHLIDCRGSTGIFNHSHDHYQLKLFRFTKAHQLPNLPLDK